MASEFSINSLADFCSRLWGILRSMLRFAASHQGVMLKTQSSEGAVFFSGNEQGGISQVLCEISRRMQVAPDMSKLTVGTQNAAIRDRWIESVLSSLPEGTKLLDAGAGEMQYRKFCTHLNYVSQDLAQYNGSGNAAGLQTGCWDTSGIDIVSDICAIPVEDVSFDAVLCTEVLEHLTDPLKALQELSRVLRPGGKLIMTAPFSSLTHFAPYHYATGFNKYFYLHHLTELGFQDIEVKENGNFFEFIAQELRRLPSMVEQYASSKLSAEGEFAITTLLLLLQAYSERDAGSAEILHFDCQVTATKKS